MKTTADRLKQIMEERGLRQVDILNLAKPFCEKFGGKLTRQDLCQYVSGKVEPKQEKIFILAAALNVSEPWLMGYDTPRERTRSIVVEELGNAVIDVEDNTGSTERLSAYYAELARQIAYLSEDSRDSIVHQIKYEYEKEKKRRADH